MSFLVLCFCRPERDAQSELRVACARVRPTEVGDEATLIEVEGEVGITVQWHCRSMGFRRAHIPSSHFSYIEKVPPLEVLKLGDVVEARSSLDVIDENGETRTIDAGTRGMIMSLKPNGGGWPNK